MSKHDEWAGPLFYPPIGKVAVMVTGTRIKVWADEGRDAACFTGINLADGDASTMWDRARIVRVEP